MKDEHWDLIALKEGFDCMEDLLRHWYTYLTKSKEAIADDLGVHRSTVARLLHNYGIATRLRDQLLITREEAVNLTVEQIARKHSVTRSTAWRAKKKALGGKHDGA